MSDSFTQHPFWTYSLRLYAQPQVQDDCLTLQDEHGLDVNLVLFCIWAGLDGPGQLTVDELNEAIARGSQWQSEVVERIRYIR
ncbi:MAG: TIGR02444 family protein, partial [Gammaproteobacteria bacterium]